MSRILSLLTFAALGTLAAAVSLPAAAQAPIERSAPTNARRYHGEPRTTEPAPGIRVISSSTLDKVAADADHTELRLAHGTAAVAVDHPAEGALILVDLPAGQVDLLKDGFYTLNADTNVLTVHHGEADVFAQGAAADAKGTTVKEGESIVLGANAHPRAANREELGVQYGSNRGDGYRGDGFYGDGFYGDGYGYPAYGFYGDYYGYGYPYYGYGWGYPYYGYGWGLGLGFGYGWGGWGGWHGGYRGFGGGFHGGGFRR